MKFKKGNYYGLFILLNIILFLIAFWAIKTDMFHKLDEVFYNFTQTSSIFKKKVNQANQKVVIIGIDNKFFTKEWITTSTFHRWYYAQAIKKLQEAWVTTIAIDVVFNDLKYKKIQDIFIKKIDEAISTSFEQYNFISEELKLQINNDIQNKIKKNLAKVDITQEREFTALQKSIDATLLSVLEPYDDINISNMQNSIKENIEKKIKIFSNEKYIKNYFYSESLNFFDDSLVKEMKENVVIWTLVNNNQVEYPPEKFLSRDSDIWHVISHDNIYWLTMWVVPFYQDKKWRKVNSLWIQTFINYRKQIEIKENQIPIQNNDITSQIENPKSLLEPKKLILQIPNNLPIKVPLSNIGDPIKNTTTSIMITPIFIKSMKDINYYSLYDILHTDSEVLAQTLEGKVVFIWATDQAFKDIKLTIVWNIPWVYMHANNFIAMDTNQYVTSINKTQTLLIIYVFLILGMLFILSFHTELASFVIFAIFIWVIVIIGATIYKKYGIWFPVWSFLAIIVIKFIFDIFYALVINLKNKEFVTSFFNRYVGKNVLQKKYISGTKDAESKNLGIFFSDIASFTNISEKLTATEVVRFLNIYLTECSWYIIQNNGYIDKYIWDAIMGFWEDSKHSDRLLISAILITQNHDRINKIIEGALEKNLNIRTRIGLHFWEGIVGDIWDKNNKINYTIIWDNVNLGSRLEGINKFYGTTICMSENTVDRIAKKGRFAYRLMDQITVKWKEKPVKIYELIAKLDNIDETTREYIKQFEWALESYFAGKFGKAREEFLKLQVFSMWQDDPVLSLFIKRCADLIVSPPEGWTGIWKYDKKW